MKNTDYYLSLIHKMLTAQSTEKELHELQEWVAEDPENQRKLDEIKLIWNEPTGDEEPSEVRFVQGLDVLTKGIHAASDAEKKSIRHKWTAVAFATAFTILILALLKWFPSHESSAESYSFNQQSRSIRLPEHSAITLHENARISTRFTSHERTVTLQGMAFFEVEKEDRPFLVRAGDAVVRVIGTSFFLRSSDSESLEIFVARGKVEVHFDETRWIVVAGEYLRLAQDSLVEIRPTPPENFNAWYTRKLHFNRTELKEVMIALEQYYDVNIASDKAIGRCRFTGTFDNLSLDEVIKILSYSMEIEFKRMSSTSYYISGKGCVSK